MTTSWCSTSTLENLMHLHYYWTITSLFFVLAAEMFGEDDAVAVSLSWDGLRWRSRVEGSARICLSVSHIRNLFFCMSVWSADVKFVPVVEL